MSESNMESSGNPSLEIIIVGATGYRDMIRDALQSLVDNPYSGGEMIVHVVDNDSNDGTREMIAAHFPAVEFHEMGRNAGFCAANNAVLRGSNADFILLLNPDTEVYPGALDRMIQTMATDDTIGVSGCRLELRDGSFDHAAKRSFPTPLGAVGHFTGLGSRLGGAFNRYTVPELDEYGIGEVDSVNGAFMLVRKEALRDVGEMDEGYWMYGEDLDWCYRFKQAGWKVWYDGSVSILHIKGGGSKKQGHRDLKRNYAFHRTMARFYRKFYSGENRWMDAIVYVGIGAKFSVSAARSAVARRSFK